MEVVATAPNGNGVPPFRNHDVREWSRIDSLTGVLERARLETDHWAANTSNSSHKYGKVVDSRARSDADGAVQQRARRQLEVFQSSVPGGHLQVIKSHTVSSSRWTSKSSSSVGERKNIAHHFGDLELSLNPLDLSSQKSKATVGRSVGRRPPSRPRARDEPSSIGRQGIPLTSVHSAAAVNLHHRVSRLCHQIHDNAVKQTFGKYLHKPPIHERESGDGVEIIEIESVNSSDNEKSKPVNGHVSLTRTKSSSSEDLHSLNSEKDKPNKSIEDLEDLEQLQNWRRTSKIRRSLQFPKQNKASATAKPLDLPENTGSVRKIREDLETGRRLSTALRGNNVDLEALDQILQSISSSNGSDKNSTNSDKYEPPEKDIQTNAKKQKRNSFVTVESLKEVKGRLRRTSSPTEDIYKSKTEKSDFLQRYKKEEEADDGIVTEENQSNLKRYDEMPVSENLSAQSRVRSYVYGMEAVINKKHMPGTGSLESRASKQLNGTSGYRSEDWYNRRKSYGFEQVHNHQEPINSISKNKSLMESSTDSGICRSSEIVLIPTSNKSGMQLHKSSDYNSEVDSEKEDKYLFSKNSNKYPSENGSVVLNVGSVKRYTSIFEQKKENSPVSNRKTQDVNNMWNNRPSLDEYQNERLDKRSPRKEFEGTTITIPIVLHSSDNFNKNTYLKQFDDSRFCEDNSWSNAYNQNGEIKRHSIAVDESKYVTRSSDNKYRRTSLAINDRFNNDPFLQDGLEDDTMSQNKKQKKVEFCKTEVHFAAESGRVNIVATDEKPPPTNNFRRRRRNSATLYNQLLTDMNKNGLPVLHFGDSSYEKNLFGIADQEDDPINLNDCRSDINSVYDNKQTEADIVTASTVTVSTNQSYQNYQPDTEDDQKENLENEAPKGILKNKPIKPKPYLLGDDNFFKQTNSDNEESGIWGVKLKPVQNKIETPMWRSTVTLKNTLYDRQQEKDYSSLENSYSDSTFGENRKNPEETTQPEFQKMLRTLRPAKKQLEYSEEQRNIENYEAIRIIPPQVDPRRSSWSVADMVKQVEDVQKTENKGYSTKVNIGGGEATVIEDHLHQEKSRHPTWPRRDDTLKDGRKQILNKGLVVRIGRDETKSHTVCSKTTMDNDSSSTTTTTKITIDLSPSPTNDKPQKEPVFQSVRLPRATLHNFKSTSLILNTFKNENYTTASGNFTNSETTRITKSNIPQQLEALRKLYEDWQSDSEADKEVQSLMNHTDEESIKQFDDDNSSVVSGSWSKMRACRNMQQQRNKTLRETLHASDINLKSHARIEKDFSNLRVSQNPQQVEFDETPTSNKGFLNESTRTWEKQQKQSISNKTPQSPTVVRKTYNHSKNSDLKAAYDNNKLSSPFLVGQNVYRNEYESDKAKRMNEFSTSLRRRKENHLEERISKTLHNSSPTRTKERRSPTPTKETFQNYSPARQKDKRSPSPIKHSSPKYSSPTRQKEKRSPSPTKETHHHSSSKQKEKQLQETANENNLVHKNSGNGRQKSPSRSVLRNPRKSEMAYFGVKTSPSPKSIRKSTEINDKKSWDNKPDLLQHYDVKETVRYRKEKKTETKVQKSSPDRRSRHRPESPVYENIDEIKRYKPKTARKEFDSSILDELTKAADQILQAVNGYAEDSHKQSDEEKSKRTKKEKLDTISETKSWKQGSTSKHKNYSHKNEPTKPKLKHTSSTSSIESIAEQRKSGTPSRTTTDSDKHKKKYNGETSTRAATKARRLQRASSREALLQSHGSSSEDLPISIEVPIRKPRLVRKTKATQLTVTNVVEISKVSNSTSRKREEKGKSEERVPVGALPEIRHKTAVSTIRSTAEKSASRDRLHRSRTEEVKKKSLSKKETSRISSTSKSDKIRSISSKDPINHRISTANIKKCNKSEGSARQ